MTPPPIRRPLRLPARLALAAAWTVLLGALGLLGLEESGVLVPLTERALGARLGPLAGRLSIDRVGLSWFDPGLVLEGVSLRAQAGGSGAAGADAAELLRLKTVRMSLVPVDGRPSADRILVRGGRVRVGDELVAALEEFVEWRNAQPPGRPELLPAIGLFDFDVELDLPDATPIDIGRLDLVAERTSSEQVRVRGQLAPRLLGRTAARGAIFVEGEETPDGLRLRAAARSLAVDWSAGDDAALAALLPLESVAGRLDLEAEVRLELGERVVPGGMLRARVADGELRARGITLQEARLGLDASFEPGADIGLWRPAAWSVASRLEARWEDGPLIAWGQLGRGLGPDRLARVWARAPRLRVEPEAMVAILGEPARPLLEAYRLEGEVDATAELRIGVPPRGVEPAERTLPLEAALHVRSVGGSRFTFVGELDDNGEPDGLPIPCTSIFGDVLGTWSPERTLPWQVGLVGLRGDAGQASVRADGLIVAPAVSDADPRPRLDLSVEAREVPLDDRLREAFAASPSLREIWPEYSPSGGVGSSSWRLHRGPDTRGLVAHGLVRIDGVRVVWSELPAPLQQASLELEFAWSTHPTPVVGSIHAYRPIGVGYRVWNGAAAAERSGLVARISGFSRQETLPPEPIERADVPLETVQGLEIEIEDLLLRGRDFDVLTWRFPELGREIDALGAKGGMDVHFYGAKSALATPYETWIEAAPRVVEVTPRFFPRRTRNLSGRVLLSTREIPESEDALVDTRLVLWGQWPDGVELAARGRVPPSGAGSASIEVFGAGIDPTNMVFQGAFARGMAGAERGEALDLSGQRLSGRFDLHAVTEFRPESPDPPTNRYSVFLRGNALSREGLDIGDLRGVLEQVEGSWHSPRLEAQVAGHPIELADVRIFRLGDAGEIDGVDPILTRGGFWSDPDGSAFQARLSTVDLPLDPSHLAALGSGEAVPPSGGAGEPARWGGRLDIDDARIVLTGEPDGVGKLALVGDLRPHDMAFTMGLPLAIRDARARVGELVVEAGRLRGWARVEGLEADIADRALTDGSVIVSYVDGRLTLDDLVGSFEGGTLAALGGERQGGTALALDLSDPHGFDLRIEMIDVSVEGLLKGVFHSTIADKGRLDLGLRLKGEPGRILDVTGSGWLNLDDGQLWSIPVMRELFGQLGFDETAIFKRMRARFQVRDGVFQTSEVKVQSDLLDLVGSGEMDFDGRLDYDLEVRYGLIDRLGPLNKILYWFNNNLWRIAIRGDMDRPRVVIRNTLFEFLRGFEERNARALPLPEFAPLPRRF